ncbi:hypothetical protein Sm713_01260 [Streptomyces sp. TS71-3]|nr:hypothetical protein Sm713_01260 [Streptomyces sp. TS71-3]
MLALPETLVSNSAVSAVRQQCRPNVNNVTYVAGDAAGCVVMVDVVPPAHAGCPAGTRFGRVSGVSGVRTTASPSLNHSELPTRYTGSTKYAPCDPSHSR